MKVSYNKKELIVTFIQIELNIGDLKKDIRTLFLVYIKYVISSKKAQIC